MSKKLATSKMFGISDLESTAIIGMGALVFPPAAAVLGVAEAGQVAIAGWRKWSEARQRRRDQKEADRLERRHYENQLREHHEEEARRAHDFSLLQAQKENEIALLQEKHRLRLALDESRKPQPPDYEQIFQQLQTDYQLARQKISKLPLDPELIQALLNQQEEKFLARLLELL